MKKSLVLFVPLIFIENFSLLVFFKKGIINQQLNSLLFFVSGLLFSLALIKKFYNKGITSVNNKKTSAKSSFLSLIALNIIIFLFLYFLNAKTLKNIVIDYHYSDIIPAIQIMVQRFLHGHYPYTPLSELGYTAPAGYMPMHWLPFCFAELGHFDYRLITFGMWCIAAIILSIRSFQRPFLYSSLVILLLAGSFYLIYRQSDGIIGITVELLIAAYYMLMIMGLNTKNGWLQGLLIAFCLLSRYSLMFWLPLWAFVLLVSGHRKDLIKASTVILVLCSVLYVIPFLSRDWSLFFTTIKGYSNLSWEWGHVDDNGKPFHLFNGIGFAYLFYNKYKGTDYMIGFQLLRKVFFIITISSILLMAIWYWFNKQKINYRIFLMASFKIYLTIFFSFMLVPYEYLMVVGNFVSIAIFAEQLRYKVSRNL